MNEIEKLESTLFECDALVIGAGSGLSTAAGLTYSGERFQKYFFDFAEAFGIRDIYSGGFYPFPDEETLWAWWARHIYFNRYINPPKKVYVDLLSLVSGKDYFVLTTNVDHQFQRAGFDKKRLFYTQGDYGLFQTTDGKNGKTYDNQDWVMRAIEAQKFILDSNGIYQLPENGSLKMQIPSELIPKCPDDGSRVTMNLRADDTFVQDKGWYKAAKQCEDFLQTRNVLKDGKVLFLELGVGANTPGIIKYPFWQMTAQNPNAVYACLNFGEAFAPKEISGRSICINDDIGKVLKEMI
ncbi:MAG: Sir2 silent information regulator family NAD-dependent deacetylase [Treponema sp.]|nr:Sir2 silent information regulator family NAD-dependent deacetylase [Treponema sp.]